MPGFTTNYSSSLTSNSALFTRPGGSGSFYYETLELNCTATGVYNFTSSSIISTYGYLYTNQFNSANLSANLVTSNGGTGQIIITFTLQAGIRYIFIFTTYYPSTTGLFTLYISGPSTTTVLPINALPSSTTSTMPGFNTNYSSSLTSSSASFTRLGGSGSFYYETLELNCTASGTYNFTSVSMMSTYGYLHTSPIISSNLSINLVASNGGTGQFLITITLQAGIRYIFIFTTYYPSTTGLFTLYVSGPSTTMVFPVNVPLSSTASSTVPTTTSTAPSMISEYKRSSQYQR